MGAPYDCSFYIITNRFYRLTSNPQAIYLFILLDMEPLERKYCLEILSKVKIIN